MEDANELHEPGCCDCWSSPVSSVNGECPECGTPTVDGEAAYGCNWSDIYCTACGHRMGGRTMNDTLRLKGKTTEGEEIVFDGEDIAKWLDHFNRGLAKVLGIELERLGRLGRLDPATIQLADDPRKQMLDEIRAFVDARYRDSTKTKQMAYGTMLAKLDEMEAKL